MHKVILANQKTESFVYRWQRALAMFDMMFFPRICQSTGHHFKRSVNTLIEP